MITGGLLKLSNHEHDHNHSHNHDHNHDHDHDHHHHEAGLSPEHTTKDHQEAVLRDAALQNDKKDLIGVLTQRFGSVTDEVVEKINEVTDLNRMDKLFVVAVNAADWDIFVEELRTGKDSFKIIGEEFNPLAKVQKPKE